MDENRRAALLAELEDMKRERDDLNIGIQVLAGRLGVTAEGTGTTDPDAPRQTEAGSPPATPEALVDLVLVDEFYGQSIPKATDAILKRWAPGETKRPIKTTVLVAAMNKGGLNVDAKQVYRSLWKVDRFHNIGRGRWGLVAWYPASVLNKAKTSDDLPTDAVTDEPKPSDEPPADADDGENVRPLVGRTEPTTETEVAAS